MLLIKEVYNKVQRLLRIYVFDNMEKPKKWIFRSILFLVMTTMLFGIVEGTFLYSKFDPKNDYFDNESMSETQFNIIHSGLQGYSLYNSQPWLIKIINDVTFELYMDSSKLLPAKDPEFKYGLISQGSFLGDVKLCTAANGLGIEVAYELVDLNDNNPYIAEISITDVCEVDTLSSASLSVKGSNVNLSTTLDGVFYDSIFKYKFYPASHYVVEQELNNMMKLETENAKLMKERLNMYRFTKWDKNKHKNGLGLQGEDFMVQTFQGPLMKLISHETLIGNYIYKNYVKAKSSIKGYLIIYKSEMSPNDWILLGEKISETESVIEGFRLFSSSLFLLNQANIERLGITGNQENYEGIIVAIKSRGTESVEMIRHKVSDIIID